MPSNQINYINKYNKNNYKMYQFRVKKTELDLINKLDNISNRNSYITNLILEDLNVQTCKARGSLFPLRSQLLLNDYGE